VGSAGEKPVPGKFLRVRRATRESGATGGSPIKKKGGKTTQAEGESGLRNRGSWDNWPWVAEIEEGNGRHRRWLPMSKNGCADTTPGRTQYKNRVHGRRKSAGGTGEKVVRTFAWGTYGKKGAAVSGSALKSNIEVGKERDAGGGAENGQDRQKKKKPKTNRKPTPGREGGRAGFKKERD